MKRFIRLVFPLICIVSVSAGLGQDRSAGGMQGAAKITMIGKVVDALKGTPLEYATVLVYSMRDGKQITGCVTAADGTFSLPDLFPGRFKMTFKFMGFKTQTIENVAPARGAASHDIGVIRLESTVLTGEGVDVQADRPEFEYKIDKRVINVGQQHTALSGTAVDVLENVPSVTVDIEGNVQLRGSGNFTVLIDNRPTPLESNEALQQTPASTIDQIEIITNPSAKYEPDGTAGIINIVMKKTKRIGVNGIANVNLGLDDLKNRYGGDILMNFRTSKANFFLGGDYNRRSFPGSSRVEHREYMGDTTTYRYSSGDSRRGGTGKGLRGGVDYSVTASDLFSAGFRTGGRSFGGDSRNAYDEWTAPGGIHAPYRSLDASDREENYYELNADYKHNFAKAGHELLAQANVEGESGHDGETNELFDARDSLTSGQRSTESGPSRDIRIKLDYTLPMRPNEKLQAGAQTRIGTGDERNELFDYEAATGGYVFLQPYSHSIDYTHTIHSVYGTYSNEFRKIGFQGGIRGEYTGRDIRLEDTGQKFAIDRWDFFPTVHLSYTFAQGRQTMASYTRRIQRPHEWELEPFLSWMDAYNVRQGNPDLKPEFIDSYEWAFQSSAGQSLFSVETYYRTTHNKVERVQSLYAPQVTLQSIENIGRDYSLGSELMINVNPVKPWNVNLMGNLYQYRVEGGLFGEAFSRNSFNWSVRFNNTIRFTPLTRLQINGMYNSASVSSQGRREGNFMVNFGLRQEFFNRVLSATLQVRDAFRSGVFESTTEGRGFYNYSRMKRHAPVYNLTLTFNINNYKREQQGENGNGDGNGNGNGREEGDYEQQ
jgi:outer membrane receptor protein involved in Fe transport